MATACTAAPEPVRWTAGGVTARQHAHQGASLRHRRQRGERPQALGISRGGRTTKIHALTDDFGRPRAFLLSPGQAADCRAGEPLLRDLPPECLVIADRAYDTDAVRQRIEAQGAAPNIPSKRNRRGKACFSPVLYRGRNAIERMFCRLKDWRRVATRYDKLAATHLAAVHLAPSSATGCESRP
jgi:transposase